MLQEQDRQKLDAIVSQMVNNKESDSTVQAVVNDFKSKYEKTPGPKVSILEKVGDFVGGGKLASAAGQLLGGVSSSLEETTTETSKNIDSLIGQARKLSTKDPRRQKLLDQAKQMSTELSGQASSVLEGLPTEKQAIGSAAQLGLTIGTLGGVGAGMAGKLGAVKSVPTTLGSKMIKGSALGAGFGAAGALQTDRTPGLTDLAIGVGTGAAIPVAGAGLGYLKEFIGKTIPKRLVGATLPADRDISDWFIKNKKIGRLSSMISESKSAVENLSFQIDDTLKASESLFINKKGILKSVAQSYGQTGGGGTLNSKEIIKVINSVAPQAKGLLSREQLTISDANKLRRILDQTLGSKFFLSTQAPFKKEVMGTFNDFLRSTVQEKVPLTKPLFAELSKEITYRNSLRKLSEKIEKRKLVGFGDLVFGGVGYFGAGLPGVVATTAIKKGLQAPQTSLGAAKAFTKLGQVKVPQAIKQATKLGVLTGATNR